jgi:hypothetical protein
MAETETHLDTIAYHKHNSQFFVNGKVGRQSPITESMAGLSPSCPLPGIPTFGPFLVGFLRFRI